MTLGRRSAVIAALFLSIAGCANPNFIGVQDYGTVYGNVVGSNGSAISGAYVSITGSTTIVQSTPTGGFSIPNVAVGEQTLMVQAPGFVTSSAQIVVTKDQSVNAGNVTLSTTPSPPPSH